MGTRGLPPPSTDAKASLDDIRLCIKPLEFAPTLRVTNNRFLPTTATKETQSSGYPSPDLNLGTNLEANVSCRK